MSMFALPGHKVRLHESSKHSGYESEIKKAQQYLTIGEIYTVKRTRVSHSHSWVEVEEVPGVFFNTIHFRSLTAQTEQEDQQSPEFIRWYGPSSTKD